MLENMFLIVNQKKCNLDKRMYYSVVFQFGGKK